MFGSAVTLSLGSAGHDWSRNKEIQTIQVLARGKKRGHDNAFSDSSAEGMK